MTKRTVSPPDSHSKPAADRAALEAIAAALAALASLEAVTKGVADSIRLTTVRYHLEVAHAELAPAGLPLNVYDLGLYCHAAELSGVEKPPAALARLTRGAINERIRNAKAGL